MYFADLNVTNGNLIELRMSATRTLHFSKIKASRRDLQWMYGVLKEDLREKFDIEIMLDEEDGQIVYKP